MKKLFMLMIVCGIVSTSFSVFAQIRKVPAEVTEAFKAQFPITENLEWRDKLTVFEATFEMKGIKYQATFNSKGEWQSTEKFIAENDLPSAVKDGLNKSKYNDWEKKSIIWLETKEKRQYRILVEKGVLQKKYLYFNSDGQLEKEVIAL